MNSSESKHTSLTGMALMGAAVVLGWCTHDLVLFVTSGQPALARSLIWTSFLLVVCGLLAGGLLGALGRRVPVWVLFMGAVLALGLSCKLNFGLSEERLLLGRSLAFIELSIFSAAFLSKRHSLGPVRCAFALGLVACVIMGAWQIAMGLWQSELPLQALVVLGAAIGLLGVGYLPRAGLRRALSLLLLIGVSLFIGNMARQRNLPARADLAGPSGPVGGAGRNLLLVVLDTVRADHLASYGYGRVTTPMLDAFAESQAERYEWARSASSWTLPSHASLFTGLVPSEHGATHPRAERNGGTVLGGAAQAQSMREDVATLAEVLSQHGYQTAAVLANHYYLGNAYGLARGFQHYDVRPGGEVRRFLPLAQMAWLPLRAGRQSYRDSRTVSDRALDWLGNLPQERPWFLALNYMDAHSPYFPEAPHDRAFGGPAIRVPVASNLDDRVLQYDRGLRYIDAQLARVLEAVDLEKTVVIVTSDHGEGLGDHGYSMHGWTLFDSVLRVPLFVHPVGRERFPLRSDPIGGAQIFALALFELGLGERLQVDDFRPAGEWFQTLDHPQSKALIDKDLARDLMIWTEDTLKWTVSSTGEVSVFDLSTDPGELLPLELDEVQEKQALERALDWWAAHPPLERAAIQVMEEDLDPLRDLGYLGDEN